MEGRAKRVVYEVTFCGSLSGDSRTFRLLEVHVDIAGETARSSRERRAAWLPRPPSSRRGWRGGVEWSSSLTKQLFGRFKQLEGDGSNSTSSRLFGPSEGRSEHSALSNSLRPEPKSVSVQVVAGGENTIASTVREDRARNCPS
ncbi:hypothetical protein Ancab_026280 [Ancistrocladus abbreviatus]